MKNAELIEYRVTPLTASKARNRAYELARQEGLSVYTSSERNIMRSLGAQLKSQVLLQ